MELAGGGKFQSFSVLSPFSSNGARRESLGMPAASFEIRWGLPSGSKFFYLTPQLLTYVKTMGTIIARRFLPKQSCFFDLRMKIATSLRSSLGHHCESSHSLSRLGTPTNDLHVTPSFKIPQIIQNSAKIS